MARFVRATLLLTTTLGVAAAVPPASTAAAANAGGAAPGTVVRSGGSANGGAAPGSAPRPVPLQKATSARTGGAVPGYVPRRRVARQRPAHRPKRKPAPAPPSSPTVAGVFPVAGPFSFGGQDARFGAQRNGHVHQGQDVIAASGTPIVAPIAGTIVWKADQPGGAGIYLVLHGTDDRDHVFMHIKRGTVLVAAGEAVRAGQPLAQVGATGDATGPHLHFEIWVGGWGTKDGEPIDPLPQLKRWAGLAP